MSIPFINGKVVVFGLSHDVNPDAIKKYAEAMFPEVQWERCDIFDEEPGIIVPLAFEDTDQYNELVEAMGEALEGDGFICKTIDTYCFVELITLNVIVIGCDEDVEWRFVCRECGELYENCSCGSLESRVKEALGEED